MISKLTSTGGWNRGEIYAGGRHLATYVSSTTYFAHGDWLATPRRRYRHGAVRIVRIGPERARTNVSGDISETCQGLPFGDGLSCSGSDVSPLHFTGKQHDSETGLALFASRMALRDDYFGARYDSSSTGRFMTPDWSAKVEPVPYAKLGDPQSLNLYTYVMNNPVTDLDADGHCSDPTGCNTPPPAKSANLANRQARAHRKKPGFFQRAWQWVRGKYKTAHNAYHKEQVWMASHPNVEAAIMIGAAVAGGGEGEEGEGEGGGGGLSDVAITGTPSVPPPTDPAESPGPGWEWKGTGRAGRQFTGQLGQREHGRNAAP